MPKINFFYNDTNFNLDKKKKAILIAWLQDLIAQRNFKLVELNYNFCSDGFLSQYNLHYLNHDTLTDIITFDNSDHSREIEADVLISVERVAENAQKYQVSFERELARVMVHGVLHLLGLGDKTVEEKQTMRQQEDLCLANLGTQLES